MKFLAPLLLAFAAIGVSVNILLRDKPESRPRWWVGLGCVSAVVCGLCYLVSGLDYMAQFIGGESLRFRETKECRDSSNETSPGE
jgi:hypothetical protein